MHDKAIIPPVHAGKSRGLIRVLVDRNPKQAGSKSYRRFDCYEDGMSTTEYEAKVRRLYGDYECRKCKADLAWDTERYFIAID